MELSEIKSLYEVLEDRILVEYAIKSIANDYVILREFEDGEYFRYGDFYYSTEDYVILEDGNLSTRDDAYYCNGLDEYVSYEETVTVYQYRSENTFSRRWAENESGLSEYRGNYYDSDALSYHDLCYIQDEDEIGRTDDAYYHEDSGEYYSYPEERYVRGYHDGSYKTYTFDDKSKYKIGYEIEKEDNDVLESINIEDFEEETEGYWRKEKDGSLDSDSGFEMISPTFEFNIDKIFGLIEGNDVLKNHINADYSKSCGGHIHLSEKGLDGYELFDKIKGYTPLLYALYYGRVDQNYCKGKNNRDLKDDNEKYQAIKIHNNRVEFRIISAVINVKTLKWRSKLLMMILQNPTSDVIKAYYNVDTKFTKLLKQTYSDEKLVELKERFIKFTKKFEGLDIK